MHKKKLLIIFVFILIVYFIIVFPIPSIIIALIAVLYRVGKTSIMGCNPITSYDQATGKSKTHGKVKKQKTKIAGPSPLPSPYLDLYPLADSIIVDNTINCDPNDTTEIVDLINETLENADKRIATRSIISGEKSKRAIDGYVNRRFNDNVYTEELMFGENQDWWEDPFPDGDGHGDGPPYVPAIDGF